jgi:hypothetical protein
MVIIMRRKKALIIGTYIYIYIKRERERERERERRVELNQDHVRVWKGIKRARFIW